jgi:hypothetical protein
MTQITQRQDVVHSPYTPATENPGGWLSRVDVLGVIIRAFISSATATVLLTATAVAQQKPEGAVTGVVMDSTGAPIPNVEVTAIKVARVVRTDTAGQFILGGLPPGPTDLSFRRLAYAPVVLSLQVPPDDTTDVEVTLGLVAQQLTGVIVQADAQRLRILEAFEARRKHGIGHFITRRQIAERQPMRLSDMVRLIPGASISEGSNGRTALRFSRSTAKACPPQFYIDGIQATEFSIDDMPPGDVEGIELYAGPGGLPPEFNRFFSTVSCGTVIIWTRIPGNDRGKP